MHLRKTKRYITYLTVAETRHNAAGKRLGMLAYARAHRSRQRLADVYGLHDLSQNKHIIFQGENKSSVCGNKQPVILWSLIELTKEFHFSLSKFTSTSLQFPPDSKSFFTLNSSQVC